MDALSYTPLDSTGTSILANVKATYLKSISCVLAASFPSFKDTLI